MTEVRLRNVEPEAIEVIREMARRRSQTMEHFLRECIYELAEKEKREMLSELRTARETESAKVGELPDGTPAMRAEREARW